MKNPLKELWDIFKYFAHLEGQRYNDKYERYYEETVKMCDHINFNANVDIDRNVEQNQHGEVLKVTYRARVSLKCKDCGADVTFDPTTAETEDKKTVLVVVVKPKE